MKKIELKSRLWLRKLFGGISITAMAFVFHACYGMPPDEGRDVKLSGTVKSKTTNMPIKGIKVTVNEGLNYGFTDENGNFNVYASLINAGYTKSDSVSVSVFDIDGDENGLFAEKTIVIDATNKREVNFDVELEEVKLIRW